MKPYRYEKTFETNFSDVDFKDERKISSYLSMFEIVASESAEELGFGYSYLKKHGYTFFLSDIRCELKSMLPLGSLAKIITWPTPPSHVIFGREFVGIDENDEKILTATSRWCAIDVSTGKILSSKAFPEQQYSNPYVYDPTLSNPNLRGKIAKFSMAEGEEQFVLKIANSEYDHNMHVNNTKYADYCLNCFSVAELAARQIDFFAFSYVKQCKEGDVLRFFRKNNGNSTIICGFNQCDENVVRAEFSFRSR